MASRAVFPGFPKSWNRHYFDEGARGLTAGGRAVHTEQYHNALTLPDYFGQRFEVKSRFCALFRAGFVAYRAWAS